MRGKLAAFTLSLIILSVAIGANGQQKTPGEFVSPIGEFGIMLPQSKVQVFTDLSFQIENEKPIVFAIGKVDLEAKADLLSTAILGPAG